MKIAPTVLLATIQLNLVRRPLMHPCTAEECLDVSRLRLNTMVECGELPWAWDFSMGTTRKEMRLLAHCVVEKATGTITAIGPTKNLNLPEVLMLVLPQRRQSLRGIELQKLFRVGHDHINHLHAAGEITKISEKLPAVGPNASPRYTRESLVNLPTKRRLA